MKNGIQYRRIYFLGAGSTASLNFPTTEQQNEYIAGICFEDKKIERISEDKNLPQNNDFDVNLLKRFVQDFFQKNNFSVNLLFNLCDSRTQSQMGLFHNGNMYSEEVLTKIKKTIKALIFNLFSLALNHCDITALKSFYKKLATKALSQKIKMVKEHENIQGRAFIFTDYAIVNLNWDLLSILPMLVAHQELNIENNNFGFIDEKSTKIKIFNDFASFMACNKDDEKFDIWYPYNESVAIRINDPDYHPNRIVTLVKTFYPHGLMNLYRCRWCGRHTLNIGSISVETLIRKDYFSNNMVFECPHCGGPVRELDIEYLEQSNHKIRNPYLEEISIDMKTALSNTEEIIFMGYSLPPDDIDYREILAACNNNRLKNVKVVLYDSNYRNDRGFHDIDYYNVSSERKKTMENYVAIFGKEKVKFNMSGIPNCFEIEELF